MNRIIAPAFSSQLEAWAKRRGAKDLGSLVDTFQDKSFAVIMALLMVLPALPLPTGGVTHVFETITALLALEQIAGLRALWVPPFLARRLDLAALVRSRAFPRLVERIQWFERHASPRGSRIFALPFTRRLMGLLALIFTLGAFFAPPFSGLDTLPSLGVVLISLAVILDDALLLFVGSLVGATGIAAEIFFGEALTHLAKQLL